MSIALSWSCSEDAADSPATALIGADGGRVTKSNTNTSSVDVELALPPGAIAKETEFTIRTTTDDVPNGSFSNGSIGPMEEICDGLDNDCDTVIDSFAAPCYSFSAGCTSGSCEGPCQMGTRTCSAGAWGSCQDEVGPSVEICDGLDNDCDGTVEEEAGC